MEYKVATRDKLSFILLWIVLISGFISGEQAIISTGVLGLIMMGLYISIMEKLTDIHNSQVKSD